MRTIATSEQCYCAVEVEILTNTVDFGKSREKNHLCESIKITVLLPFKIALN